MSSETLWKFTSIELVHLKPLFALFTQAVFGTLLFKESTENEAKKHVT